MPSQQCFECDLWQDNLCQNRNQEPSFRDCPEFIPRNKSSARASIPSANLPKLRSKLDRLNRKARKLGVDEMAMDCGEPYMVKIKKQDLEDLMGLMDHEAYCWVEYIDIEISGTQVKLGGGWSFVAKLEPIETKEGKTNLIKALIDDDESLEAYRDRIGICDHCELHRQRKHTYIVRSEDGETKQVGKTCLKDFTGHQDAEALAAFASMVADLRVSFFDPEGEYHEPVDVAYDISAYLGWVVAMIRQAGWLSKSKARYTDDMPTAILAESIRDDWINYESGRRSRKPEYEKPTPEDYAKGAAIVDWVRELKPDSNYTRNLKLVCDLSYVEPSNTGIAASAAICYSRAKEEELSRESQAQKSEWQGEIRKRQCFGKVKVTAHRTSDGDWGVTHIYTMEDESGNVFVWFSSKETCALGETVKLTGTVKGHSEYRVVKQTVVTRCKVEGSTAGFFSVYLSDDRRIALAISRNGSEDKCWESDRIWRQAEWSDLDEHERNLAVKAELVCEENMEVSNDRA